MGKIIAELQLNSFSEWAKSMKTLQFLVNSFKHEPGQRPSEELLSHLKLPAKPPGPRTTEYAALAESEYFREALAKSIELPGDTDYCTITEKFIKLVDKFVSDVQLKPSLAQVKVSLTQFSG